MKDIFKFVYAVGMLLIAMIWFPIAFLIWEFLKYKDTHNPDLNISAD